MNCLQAFTHLRPTYHTSRHLFGCQRSFWTVTSFHQYLMVPLCIDPPLKIPERTCMIIDCTSKDIHLALTTPAFTQELIRLEVCSWSVFVQYRSVVLLPTVIDREFCVCMKGEIPVPSKLSVISRDWLLTGDTCRAATVDQKKCITDSSWQLRGGRKKPPND